MKAKINLVFGSTGLIGTSFKKLVDKKKKLYFF